MINLFLGPKMRSPLEISNTDVMSSVRGDSIWVILPPRTFSVGFEQQFVEGVMIFTFTDPKIVIKSLFSILYFLKKNNKPHIFTPSLPSGRDGVKIWGLLFFRYFSSWKYDSSPFCNFFCSWIPPCRSLLRIRIHRIMVHRDEIPQFYDETYILCVSFVSHRQIGSIVPI